jgi:superfamily II DNA or RNA helicase
MAAAPVDDALAALDPASRDALAALALGALARTRGWLCEALSSPVLRSAGAAAPSQELVRHTLARLQSDGLANDDERRPGFWTLPARLYPVVYADLLRRVPHAALQGALAHADGYPVLHLERSGHGRFPTLTNAIARVRLDAMNGASPVDLAGLLNRLPPGLHDIPALLDTAIADCVDEALFDRLHPALQCELLAQSLDRIGATLSTGVALGTTFVRTRAARRVLEDAAPHAHRLRWSLAHDRLLADGVERRGADWAASFGTLLGPAIDAPPDDDLLAQMLVSYGNTPVPRGAPPSTTGSPAARRATAQAIGAAALAAQGRWSEAEPEFDAALAALRKATGKRRGLVPLSVALPNVLALLAQQTPAHLDKALKFCLTEGGKRDPVLDTPLGAIALAIQMRLGAAPRDLKPFLPYGSAWGYRSGASRVVSPLDFGRWLMRAWLKEGSMAEPLPPNEADAAQHLKSAFDSAGLEGQSEQLDAALRVLGGGSSPAWFFVPAGLERWQVALAALRALGDPADAPAGAAAAAAQRIVWLIETGDNGSIRSLVPHEQKRGVRGWGQLKEVPLSRLQRGAQTLAPADAGIVRAVRQETFGRALRLDLAQAMGALFNHPHVAFTEAPDVFIELVESGPELEVVDEGERLRVRMQPSLQVANDGAVARWAGSEAEQKELDALRLVSIWRDGPQRAKLIRLTASQKRVAQLLGPTGLDIPRQGAAQLQEVLTGLGSHFRIHADDAETAQAARELPAESRLRAELQPVGDGLQLRLVAAPFGTDYASVGPRLIPGRGRARVVATLKGESVGVQRDLKLERQHLEWVLDTCTMLPELPLEAPCEWLLDTADDALALVERLQPHTSILALDWPQGRPMRVATGALDQLMLKVKTHEDWLALDGKLKVDEELVVGLQQLIAFAGEGKSRFMPLGDGRFLALTQELRERVADIAVVAEKQAARANTTDELRVPTIAAPWLQAAMEGAQVEHDAGYAARLQALDDARRIVPALPSTLQAELRPYQEEGFEWAMRLASAGLGACLADDMGLGKTLQALAILLARAANGPALVVMPTSLLGNWRSEASRFAPSLRVHVYAERGSTSERAQVIAEMGRHDVLLVSYPMLQIDGEAFVDKLWATLVLDEAQAIKNAAAKRSQAVFALQATFRLAMSGTPIENRLGELWSVMRACNPGLLGTLARFNERFANLIERQQKLDGPSRRDTSDSPRGARELAPERPSAALAGRVAQRTLKRLIAPFILRRTKAQVLSDLPPRTELVLQVQGDDAEKAHYEALRREALAAAEKSLAGDGAGQAHLNILAGLTRLRRAACDPRLVTPTLKRPGAKVTAFAELATELVANGHKALVFSQFVDFLALLREPLDAAGIAYQYLDGSTPAAERTRRVEAFQGGEGDLFLISLKAGGFGLNLTVADYVVIADPWWNPAAEDQASGRAHRIGQQRPVTVYRLVNGGTLEERILTLHQTKRELADSVLEDDGAGALAPPMARELLALMRGDALPE